MEYVHQVGDIIFKDSDQGGAKVAKFFMTAPNMWIHIWRKIRGTQEKVEYYHPMMIVSETMAIEQQWKVGYKDVNDAINGHRVIIFRLTNSSVIPDLVKDAESDLGQKWGVVHVFGRFFTWVTVIPYFARYMKLPNEEVSAGRVARWLYEVTGETFGHKTYQEATTHTMVKWMLSHPDIYEVVYKED